MISVMIQPSKNEQRLASASLTSYMETLRSKKETVTLQIEGVQVELPRLALMELGKIIRYMAEGKAISIIPAESVLSTQQAADILNISRPHLVKLLDKDVIPHTRVGKHRRVKFTDVINYKTNQKKVRRKALTELQKLGQQIGT